MSPKHGEHTLVSNPNNLVRVGPPPRWVGTVSQLGRWLGKHAAEDAHCRMRGFEAGPLLVAVDTHHLVRKPPMKYIDSELQWYHSGSRDVSTLGRIFGRVPKIWQRVADKKGRAYSQYGEVVRLTRPDGPYRQAVALLKAHPLTRRAIMIYPGREPIRYMAEGGGADQCCTTSAHVFWEADNILSYMVTMRAVDAWHGFPPDIAWHRHLIRSHILPDLAVEGPVRVRMTLAVGLIQVYADQVDSVAGNLYMDRPPLDFKPAPCGYSQHG